jgi:hypothetical protein
MKSRLLAAVSFAAIAFSTTAAIAGLDNPQPTTVVLKPNDAGTASGVLTLARSSDNNVEFIHCSITTTKTGAQALCGARDAAGTYGQCFTQDPRLVAAISNIRTDALVSFAWVNQECTTFSIDISSVYGPAAP